MNDVVGYLATGIVLCSYFFKNPSTLRKVQALGAVVWMLYGFLLHSGPVIVANLLIVGIALWSSVKLAKPPQTT
jgi:hypothetical protein